MGNGWLFLNVALVSPFIEDKDNSSFSCYRCGWRSTDRGSWHSCSNTGLLSRIKHLETMISWSINPLKDHQVCNKIILEDVLFSQQHGKEEMMQNPLGYNLVKESLGSMWKKGYILGLKWEPIHHVQVISKEALLLVIVSLARNDAGSVE